jgi:hypothetical protein
MLPNPISEPDFEKGQKEVKQLLLDQDTFESAKKEAFGLLKAYLKEFLSETVQQSFFGSSANRNMIRRYAVYLAAQNYPELRGISGVKGDPATLAKMYLGRDAGGYTDGVRATSPDAVEDAIFSLAEEIQTRREEGASPAPAPTPAPAPPSPPSPEVAERVAEAEELSKLAKYTDRVARVKEIKQRGPSAIPLLRKTLELERAKGRRKSTRVMNAITQAIADLEAAEEAESARSGGSRTTAQVAQPAGQLMAAMSQLSGAETEPEEAEDEGEGEDKGGDDSYMPGSGAASPGEKRFAFTATRDKIRGAKQREEAREARVKGFAKEYMLKFRRPQSKSRNEDSNAPVLYAPPADVMAKIEEIMDADEYRKGPGRGAQSMPNQFQDVLVYILSKPFPVGRGRVIPAGSVEVYNKGTLVGTFGKKPMNTNIRKATIYAGTLVGLSFSASQPYTWNMSKRSRMHSRIYIAKQDSPGFSLLAPSLLEVMSEQRGSTPEDIELSLDAAQSAALGAQSNPRRSKSFLGTHFSPTRWGYQITSGPLRGNHYTIEEFGHGCKLAMLFDIME